MIQITEKLKCKIMSQLCWCHKKLLDVVDKDDDNDMAVINMLAESIFQLRDILCSESNINKINKRN